MLHTTYTRRRRASTLTFNAASGDEETQAGKEGIVSSCRPPRGNSLQRKRPRWPRPSDEPMLTPQLPFRSDLPGAAETLGPPWQSSVSLWEFFLSVHFTLIDIRYTNLCSQSVFQKKKHLTTCHGPDLYQTRNVLLH